MEILGVGASELIFILIIAIIVLGPKDMQKAGRTIGRWLNQLVRSDGWKAFQRASQELRRIPTNLMREANLELQEMDKDIRKSIDPRVSPPAVRSAAPQDRPVDPSEEAGASPEPPVSPSVDTSTDKEQNA
jgi:sec-independent protein translocase protein TatB